MKKSVTGPESESLAFPGKLHRTIVASALGLFRQSGMAGISIRSVAAAADVPTATIQRLFGTKQNLLKSVFSAVTESEIAYLTEILGMLGPSRLNRKSAVELYNSVLCGADGVSAERQTTLLEMLVSSTRENEFTPYVLSWLEKLEDFWSRAFSADEHPKELAQFLTELQIGLLTASTGCHRPFETALANTEIIYRALRHGEQSDRTWFRLFLLRAVEEEPSKESARKRDQMLMDRLLDAGAEIVAGQGANSLSFRTVAAKGGETFSTVTARFRSKAALFQEVYEHMSREISEAGAGLSYREGFIEGFNRLFHPKFGAPFHIAWAELRLLAARDQGFAKLAWHMRMTNGLYEARKSDPTQDVTDAAAFDAHVTATWLLGCALISSVKSSAHDCDETRSERIKFGMELLNQG